MCWPTHANLACSICILGIVTILFFQCMSALLDPANNSRRKGIKWGLVVHTTVMFSLATVATAMGLNLQSISHVDNREFPADGQFPPGPIGYKFLIYTKAISLVPNLTFQLNQWLADGLLVSFVLSPVSQVFNVTALALPLLYYICCELLGYCFSLPDVSYLFRYALGFPAVSWR